MKIACFFKKTGILFFLFAFSFIQAAAFVPRDLLQKQGNESFLATVLLPREKWVPYPSYQDRPGWDRLMGGYKTGIIKQGEKLLNYKWQVITASSYLEFSRSGSRVVMESPYSQNMTAIATLFLAEMAEGKGRFMDQLINGVFAACEMTTWSLSAHLSIQVKNKRFPDHQQQIIDLVAGDVGSMFSWIYYFLHEEFDKADKLIAQRLKDELRSRILDPYMNTDNFWWMGFSLKPEQVVNNWNVWCNSNVLQTFALMEEDRAKLAKAVYKTMRSVDQFINYNKDDGACEEGPSYWGHAAGKMYDYLQILSDITGAKVNLFDEPLIRNMGEYISRSYIGNGWVVNFADASAQGGGDAALIYRYGKAVHSEEMRAFASYLVTQGKQNLRITGHRDLFRALQSLLYNREITQVPPALPSATQTWYPQTEFLYLKNRRYFFAAKGGHNAESHNHNDVGTFSLYLDTIPFFVDAGVGTYTRQTFSGERYSIWTMQSNYHNLPLINGVAQQNGRRFKSNNVSFDRSRNRFSLDLSGAYPDKAAVKKWQRSYTISEKELKIDDAFELSGINAPSSVHFLVTARPQIIKDGVVQLQKSGKKLLLHYAQQLFRAEVDTIVQDDKRLSHVWGENLYRVRLVCKKPELKGKYTFTITQ